MADDTAPPTFERTPRWREVFRGRNGRLTAGLLLLEALVAVQSLIIATIMPDIRRDLGMTQLYGLAFTASGLSTLAAIPLVGTAIDRFGSRRVLPVVLGAFTLGLLVAAIAPAMPVLLIGHFILGAGGGGLYALSLGVVAKTFPDHLRARVLALLAAMWILPGLIGPPLGALLASTVGWRWVYVAPLPLLMVGAILIVPTLDGGSADAPVRASSSLRWPLQLMVGAGLVLTSLTVVRPWALVPIAVGIAIAAPALARIVPVGTFRAAPGVPAIALSAFLLSVGFLAMDAFLTLMLTSVRGVSLTGASLAVTAACVTWAIGSWWQSGRAQRIPLPRLVLAGTAAVIVGEAAVASSLRASTPLILAYLGWAVVGAGMGIVFPTLPLATMRQAPSGEEAGELSSVLLMDMLGVSAGAGLGGGVVAVSAAFGLSLTVGIAGSFALGMVALLALLVTGRRIDLATESASGIPG
jgi:predicted MFS family arabinose efflux permease